MTTCADQFERRVVEMTSVLRLEIAGLRQEMHAANASMRQEMQNRFAALGHELVVQRAEQLEWSFLFCVG